MGPPAGGKVRDFRPAVTPVTAVGRRIDGGSACRAGKVCASWRAPVLAGVGRAAGRSVGLRVCPLVSDGWFEHAGLQWFLVGRSHRLPAADARPWSRRCGMNYLTPPRAAWVAAFGSPAALKAPTHPPASRASGGSTAVILTRWLCPDRTPGWLDKERSIAGRTGYKLAASGIHLCIGAWPTASVCSWLPLSRAGPLTCSPTWAPGPAVHHRLRLAGERGPAGPSPRSSCCSSAAALGPLAGAPPDRASGRRHRCPVAGAAVWSWARWACICTKLWLIWFGPASAASVWPRHGTSRPYPPSSSGSPTAAAWPRGMAIMGFGGGAMIGSPLADRLMQYFAARRRRGRGRPTLVLALVSSRGCCWRALAIACRCRDGAGRLDPAAAAQANAMVTSAT